jgi:hypothetical protein
MRTVQGRDRSVPPQPDLRLALLCTLTLLDSVSCPCRLNKLGLVLDTHESSTALFAIYMLRKSLSWNENCRIQMWHLETGMVLFPLLSLFKINDNWEFILNLNFIFSRATVISEPIV